MNSDVHSTTIFIWIFFPFFDSCVYKNVYLDRFNWNSFYRSKWSNNIFLLLPLIIYKWFATGVFVFHYYYYSLLNRFQMENNYFEWKTLSVLSIIYFVVFLLLLRHHRRHIVILTLWLVLPTFRIRFQNHRSM